MGGFMEATTLAVMTNVIAPIVEILIIFLPDIY